MSIIDKKVRIQEIDTEIVRYLIERLNIMKEDDQSIKISKEKLKDESIYSAKDVYIEKLTSNGYNSAFFYDFFELLFKEIYSGSDTKYFASNFIDHRIRE